MSFTMQFTAEEFNDEIDNINNLEGLYNSLRQYYKCMTKYSNIKPSFFFEQYQVDFDNKIQVQEIITKLKNKLPNQLILTVNQIRENHDEDKGFETKKVVPEFFSDKKKNSEKALDGNGKENYENENVKIKFCCCS